MKGIKRKFKVGDLVLIRSGYAYPPVSKETVGTVLSIRAVRSLPEIGVVSAYLVTVKWNSGSTTEEAQESLRKKPARRGATKPDRCSPASRDGGEEIGMMKFLVCYDETPERNRFYVIETKTKAEVDRVQKLQGFVINADDTPDDMYDTIQWVQEHGTLIYDSSTRDENRSSYPALPNDTRFIYCGFVL